MSLKFNTLYDFDNINKENNTNNNNINKDIKAKTFKENEGMSEIIKNFIKNALNEKYINKDEIKFAIKSFQF